MRVIRIAKVGLGVTLGCIVAGAVAGVLLRRVPLGHFFLETALGATLGGLLGIVLPTGFGLGFLWVSVGGFSVAVAHLAWRYRAIREPADRALAGSRGLRV